MSVRTSVKTVVVLAAAFCALEAQAQFQLQEATIDDIHKGIRSGETTCKQVIEGYVARAKAYNGICSMPVTADGAEAHQGAGGRARRRADQVSDRVGGDRQGRPRVRHTPAIRPDYGRMEPTASDPSVYQQYGMVVGIPNAGQVNALERSTSAAGAR
jgi:hypothetical protein